MNTEMKSITSPTPLSPAKTVWVLIINHRHGTDISVHDSSEHATQALYAYCVQQWHDGLTEQYGKLDDLSREIAIDAYFHAWFLASDYEEYLLQERPIEA